MWAADVEGNSLAETRKRGTERHLISVYWWVAMNKETNCWWCWFIWCRESSREKKIFEKNMLPFPDRQTLILHPNTAMIVLIACLYIQFERTRASETTDIRKKRPKQVMLYLAWRAQFQMKIKQTFVTRQKMMKCFSGIMNTLKEGQLEENVETSRCIEWIKWLLTKNFDPYYHSKRVVDEQTMNIVRKQINHLIIDIQPPMTHLLIKCKHVCW